MRDLDPDKVLKALEAEVGAADSVTAGEHNFRCPFCSKAGYTEKTSHLHVALSKGLAVCHQCGAGFRSLHGLVLALYGKIPKSLGRKQDTGDELVEQVERMLYAQAEEESGEKPKQLRLPDGFVPLTKRPKDRLGKTILTYLTDARGVPFDYLAETGAGYTHSGKWRGYAIFPVHVGGRLVTYTSRRVTGINGGKAQHASGGATASMALFNYDQARDCRRLFVGEGPFDAYALHRRLSPDDGGIATLGTKVYQEQIRLIAALPCEEVYLWYDADAMDKATKAAQRITDICDKRLFIVRHNDKDPDELPERKLARYVREAERYSPLLSHVRARLGL